MDRREGRQGWRDDRRRIQRAFRSLLGLAPRDYVAACRRRRFLDHLRNGHG